MDTLWYHCDSQRQKYHGIGIVDTASLQSECLWQCSNSTLWSNCDQSTLWLYHKPQFAQCVNNENILFWYRQHPELLKFAVQILTVIKPWCKHNVIGNLMVQCHFVSNGKNNSVWTRCAHWVSTLLWKRCEYEVLTVSVLWCAVVQIMWIN